jgi:hypothetical protein
VTVLTPTPESLPLCAPWVARAGEFTAGTVVASQVLESLDQTSRPSTTCSWLYSRRWRPRALFDGLAEERRTRGVLPEWIVRGEIAAWWS